MNCYECSLKGREVAAVATCHHCGVGLCREHLAEVQRHRVGGTLYGCPHDLTAAAAEGEIAIAGSTNEPARVLIGSAR